MFYKSSDMELINILLKAQERTAPIKMSIGYVSEDNQVRQGILIHEASPYIIEMLMRKGYTLDLTSAGMRVYKI